MPRVVNQPPGVAITTHADRVVLTVAGEFDCAAGPALSEAIGDQRAAGVEDIVVDIRAVTFMDSAGLKTLLAAEGAALRGGWRVRIVGPCASLDRVLDALRTAETERA